MQQKIEALIKETEIWREYHRKNRNPIDAAACSIRIIALKEALAIINHD